MAASTQADLLGNRYGHLAYRRRVIVQSTVGADTRTLTPAESGAIFYTPGDSSMRFSLPKVSSFAKGLTYEFHIAKPDTTAAGIIASTIDSSAHIAGIAGTTGTTETTASAISPGSTLGFSYFARVTAVSTVVWVLETNKTVESSGADAQGALVYNDWVPASTVA